MRTRAHIATRTRVGSLLIAGCLALLMAAISPGAALASFSERYGGGSLCGSNCFVQSASRTLSSSMKASLRRNMRPDKREHRECEIAIRGGGR
jgi:hypothetical protein